MSNQWLEKVNHALWMYDHEGWDVRKVAEELAPTPPANDVREALANLIPLGFREHDGVRNVFDAADRILAAFAVRPYGTVTDAEVERATKAWWRTGGSFEEAMRAALEAAGEARS